MASVVFFLLYYIEKQTTGADSTSLTALARSVYHFSGLRTFNFLMLLTSNPIFFLVWSLKPPLNGPHSVYGILFSKLLKMFSLLVALFAVFLGEYWSILFKKLNSVTSKHLEREGRQSHLLILPFWHDVLLKGLSSTKVPPWEGMKFP